ncbi:MAG: mechanosensitive ion channel [Pseudonocardiales bacterium]|nr:mechanosensitive ion channel [Pseudonocardiales bacterium]
MIAALFPSQPACAADAGSWCARFYAWTSNDFLARSADTIVSSTAKILFIVLLALLVRWFLHRLINRAVMGATSTRVTRLMSRGAAANAAERGSQRARTLGSVLRSLCSAVVGVVAGIMVLAEFGVDLAPILASAGIVGVAVGFGAQNLVKDFLSGMFMLLEDQYGVGDIVDVGQAIGTVETVGLRITTLRDVNGTLWYVRNGEVVRVGNKSQGFAVAVVDVPVAKGKDLGAASDVAARAAQERVEQADLADDVLEDVQMLGVESVAADNTTLRLTVRVQPGRQFAVQRALNLTVAEALGQAPTPPPATGMIET